MTSLEITPETIKNINNSVRFNWSEARGQQPWAGSLGSGPGPRGPAGLMKATCYIAICVGIFCADPYLCFSENQQIISNMVPRRMGLLCPSERGCSPSSSARGLFQSSLGAARRIGPRLGLRRGPRMAWPRWWPRRKERYPLLK